jgi:uncharacterized membrane protein
VPPPNSTKASQRARQRRTILILAFSLIVGGIALLFVLKRVPLPLRIGIGLLDVFAGLGLLVLVRQKFN